MWRWPLWILAVLGFLGAVALGLARLDWPKGFWVGKDIVLVVSVGLAAFAPLVQKGAAEIGERRRRRELELAESVRAYLEPAFVMIVEGTKVEWAKAGVHAFLVSKYWVPRFERNPLRWFRGEQRRAGKVKLSVFPPPSGIRWTERKGLIGRCWADRSAIVRDLRKDLGPYNDADEATWNKLDVTTRYSLTYSEFKRTKGNFGVVAAVPILDPKAPAKYLGCVSFDTPTDCPNGLDMDAGAVMIKERLSLAAASIAEMLSQRS
jgi:hypothetical protein